MGKKEAIIEGYLVKRAAAQSILCRKVEWINRRDAPDRFLAKNGRLCLIECKAEGEEPTERQHDELVALRSEGVIAMCVNSRRGADLVIDWLLGFGPLPRIMEDIVV